MDAKGIANAAYVLQRAEANLVKVTAATEAAINTAVEKTRTAATAKQAEKLAATQAKVVAAKEVLQKLTTEA